MTAPLLRAVAGLGLAIGLLPVLRADLIVAQQLFGMSADYSLRRFDERTGAYVDPMHALNEGWTALCLGPDGHIHAAANVLGSGLIHNFAPGGAHVRELDAGLGVVTGLVFGPDGVLYACGIIDGSAGRRAGVVKLDPATGRRLAVWFETGSGYESTLAEPAFGLDGNFYAISSVGVVKHDGRSGAALGVFVPVGRGGLADPSAMAFGPDGHLYVASRSDNSVLQFAGNSGAFIRTFVPAGSGGLTRPSDLAFAGDALCVASQGTNQILRYSPTTGAALGPLVNGGMLDGPTRILFTGRDDSHDADWFDDALPAGARGGGSGGDGWNWVSGPSFNARSAPASGRLAHLSSAAPGLHEHFFNFAQPWPVGADDILYAYVFIDSAHPPREIMLNWNSGRSWEHRAYWGENLLRYAADGSPAQYRVGPLPPAGQWVRLEVPAEVVRLQGLAVKGLSLTLYDGRASFDRAGPIRP